MPRAPRFDAPVDVEAHIALLPPDASVRGVFIQDALTLAAAADPVADVHAIARLRARRYFPFLSYPYDDYLRLLDAAVGVIHPRLARGEGLRRVAWGTYDLFLGTRVGRAIFDALGADPATVLMSAARGYGVALSFGEVHAKRLGPRAVQLSFRSLPVFLEHTQVGVIEGAIRHFGHEPRVEIELRDLANADLIARW